MQAIMMVPNYSIVHHIIIRSNRDLALDNSNHCCMSVYDKIKNVILYVIYSSQLFV